MANFELLEHTADTGFRARGETPEELFIHAAEALISVALDPSRVDAFQPRQISASGADQQELLVNWLNEVLWLIDGEKFVPARFETLWFEDGTVFSQLLGERRDDTKHPPRIVVKAATFHQLRVAETESGWEAEVYLDI